MEKKESLSLYHQMVLIRRLEEKAAELYQQGKIGGFLHLYIGQEAVSTGLIFVGSPHQTTYTFGFAMTGPPKYFIVAAAAVSTMGLRDLAGKSTGIPRAPAIPCATSFASSTGVPSSDEHPTNEKPKIPKLAATKMDRVMNYLRMRAAPPPRKPLHRRPRGGPRLPPRACGVPAERPSMRGTFAREFSSAAREDTYIGLLQRRGARRPRRARHRARGHRVVPIHSSRLRRSTQGP